MNGILIDAVKINLRRPGIEPGALEWESWMLPLHQRRLVIVNF